MSLSVTCPHCSRLLELPESEAGKVTRCPECSLAFDMPPVAIPLADGPDGWQPARTSALGIPMSAWKALSDDLPPPREDDERLPPLPFGPPVATPDGDWQVVSPASSHPPLEPGWGRVSSGLRFLGGLTLVYLIANFFTACFALIGEPGAGTFAALYAIASMIGLFLCLLGLWDCCAVPAQSGVRGLCHAVAWMTCAGILFLGLGLALSFLQSLNATPPAPPMRGGPRPDDILLVMVTGFVYVLAVLLLLAAAAMFLFVLRGMALFFGEHGLAQSFLNYFLVVICAPIAGGIVIFFLAVFLDGSRATRQMIPALAWGVALVIATFLTLWLYNLLRDIRARIDTARQLRGGTVGELS